MFSREILYYGKDEPPPEQTRLRAGPLRLLFEAGDLRYIRWGEHEILRRVYVAVRDRNWGTVPPALANLRVEINPDSFEIAFEVENRRGEIDFFWQGLIRGSREGAIEYTMDGVARSTFWRNRIGFCVLHPAACAGTACRVEHVDGSIEAGRLPVAISPDQPVMPFAEMRAMAHEVAQGMWVETRYQGDVFEMEDQRNWTDASFKTFSTPLRLPYPVEIREGTRVSQSVRLRLFAGENGFPSAFAREGIDLPTFSPEASRRNTGWGGPGRPGAASISTAGRRAARRPEREAVTFSVDFASPGAPLPPLGLGVASHGQPLSEREIQRLKALRLHHLRADLALSDPGWPARLAQAAKDAQGLGLPLNLALLLSPGAEAEMERFKEVLNRIRPEVSAWLIFPEREIFTGCSPTGAVAALARRVLEGWTPGARFASGTNADFIFLQRNPPPLELLDGVTFAINPQVHSFDDASLVESLEAQAVAVRSARALSGGRPVMVSPVTLRPRWNPYATGPAPETPPGELPPQVDVRQMSLLGAGWTTGAIRSLAEGGASQVTFYETTGWHGVMETESGSPLPEIFHSAPGGVFPLYHVLADAAEFAGGQALPVLSGDPLRVNGLALRKEGQACLLLANFRAHPQRVIVTGLGEISRVTLRILDEACADFAMRQPEAYRRQAGKETAVTGGTVRLELPPCALARLNPG